MPDRHVADGARTRAREEIAPVPAAPLLSAEGLRVGYPGGVSGTHSVSLFVLAGEITLLLGANGAGKSSTLRGISGFTA